MHIRFLLYIICVSCALFGAGARERFFRNVGEMGDFGDLTINCIHADSTGFVWMGSDRGVLRCDGVHTRLMKLSDEDKPLFITSFAALPSGEMAVGTRSGLVVIDRVGKARKIVDDSPEITSLVRWSADTLLAGTVHGLRAYRRGGTSADFVQLPVDNIYSPQSHVMCMAPDSAGNLYVHTLTSLYRLDRASGTFAKLLDVPSWSDHAIGMAVSDEAVWVAMMSSGLWRVDVSTCESAQVDVNCPVVTSVDLRGDSLYVGTDGSGVYVIDTQSGSIVDHIVHELNRPGSPASNQVYSVMTDATGLLWIGYYQHGADYMVNNSGVFEVYNNPDYFNSRGVAVRTVNFIDDAMMLGTRDGLMILEPGRGLQTLHRPLLNSDMVIAVREYKGLVYIGTYGGGMSVYNRATGEVSRFDLENEIPFNRGHVFAITVDSKNRLWLGTNNGLYCYENGAEKYHFTSANSVLPVGNVYEVKFDSSGRGWVCAEAGICVFDSKSEKLRRDLLPDDFPVNDKIRTVFEDSGHDLFFLPERGSVVMMPLDLSGVRRLVFPALAGCDAKSITEDVNGYIWITTNRGMVRWNHQEELVKFGVADGLPSAQFIQCTPARDSDGSLWFGNSNGLVRLDTKRNQQNSGMDRCPVPTVVTADGGDSQVAVINCVDSAHYTIKTDRFCSSLAIDFSQFTYTSPDAVTFEYSVDGEEWTPMPYNMRVDLYNSFTDHDITLRVRPEGNAKLVTSVNVVMPMSFALKVIMALGCLALLLVGYIIYLTMMRLKRKLAERLQRNRPEENESEEVVEVEKPKYRSNPLDEDDCVRIMKLVEDVMTREKLYVDPNLKISRLADSVNISSHKLSQVLSQHVNMKFYDYVNTYRVREFKRIARRRGSDKYTLTAMSEMAGFSSRASFFRHFKDVEGISPGEYLRGLRGQKSAVKDS